MGRPPQCNCHCAEPSTTTSSTTSSSTSSSIEKVICGGPGNEIEIARCWELAVAGVPNGNCDCSEVDGTYILRLNESLVYTNDTYSSLCDGGSGPVNDSICIAEQVEPPIPITQGNVFCTGGCAVWKFVRPVNEVNSRLRLHLVQYNSCDLGTNGVVLGYYCMSLDDFEPFGANTFDFVSSGTGCNTIGWPSDLTIVPIDCP